MEAKRAHQRMNIKEATNTEACKSEHLRQNQLIVHKFSCGAIFDDPMVRWILTEWIKSVLM
jgi:hypothetical protein